MLGAMELDMNKHKGFTLIELMISLLVGLVIVGATIKIYVSTVRSSSDTVKSARLNHDLESVMSLMINDIRRAGYWGGAIGGSDSRTNPFTQIPVATKGQPNIHIPSATCLLYAYDADGDGHYDADNDNFADAFDDPTEFYGFKLENNAIKIRQSVKSTSVTYGNCTGTDCCLSTYGNWETLTTDAGSESLQITSLSFTPVYNCLNVITGTNYPSQACASLTATELPSGNTAVETREIQITLTGQLANDTTVTKTLTDFVKVRNDRIFIQP